MHLVVVFLHSIIGLQVIKMLEVQKQSIQLLVV